MYPTNSPEDQRDRCAQDQFLPRIRVHKKRRVNKLREAGMMDKEEVPKSPSQSFWTIFFRINISENIYLHKRFVTEVKLNICQTIKCVMIYFRELRTTSPHAPAFPLEREDTNFQTLQTIYPQKKEKKNTGCDDERRTTSCWINKNQDQWNNFDILGNLYNRRTVYNSHMYTNIYVRGISTYIYVL